MGNRTSIQTHVAAEITRLNELVNSNLGPDEAPRSYLTLDQLPKMKQLREQNIDLMHIGILFLLDKSLKGYFEERDFLGLAEISLKHLDEWKQHNFQQQLQAYATLQMWHVVAAEEAVFSRWFCAMLEQSSSYLARFEKLKRKKDKELGFAVYSSDEEEEADQLASNTPVGRKKRGKRPVKQVNLASVHVLHNLLMLQTLYGLTKGSFINLCLEAANEKKYETKDDHVPLPVLNDFAKEFVRGLTRLMHRLGFSRFEQEEVEIEIDV